jgi:hypothetical protein
MSDVHKDAHAGHFQIGWNQARFAQPGPAAGMTRSLATGSLKHRSLAVENLKGDPIVHSNPRPEAVGLMTIFSSARRQTSKTLDADVAPHDARRSAHLAHRRSGAGVGAACLVLAAGALTATPALATPLVTEAFPSTSTEQTFTVPTGVTSVHVRAVGETGEQGEGFENLIAGGDGAVVSAELPVTPGETLYVEVAAPGFNGGGAPSFGGGAGGGASDVRTISASDPETLQSRLLVAAGGGGGGGAFEDASGGAGGNAGGNGAEGVESDNFEEEESLGGVGGEAGTLTGGGGGGERCEPEEPWSGHGGTLGVGGAGGEAWVAPQTGGGGGGGGYYGGGGGEGQCEQDGPDTGAGGGGGGGSDYVSEEASAAFFGLAAGTTAPDITISYAAPATATPSTSSVTFPGTQPLSTVSAPQTITLTNEGSNPLTIDAATFADSEPALASDYPGDFLLDTSGCLGAVASQASCQLQVRFAPQGAGTRTATLKIAGDMGAGPTVIALTGTGGTLPQGEPGPAGPQGEPGPTGLQGQNGATGQTGAPGATGETGQTGAQGPQGPAGSQGPAGPQGEQGARGLTATYICHPRQRHGSYQEACFVTLHAPPTAIASAHVSLRRDGVSYAHGSLHGSSARGGALRLVASRRVPAGSYTLVLSSKLGVSTSTVKVA